MSLQIPFNNGTISIEDRIVSAEESDSKKFRNTLLRNAKISMVFQQLYLWPHLTCIDNIKLVSPTFDCLSLAKELRIDAILGSFPDRVSLGQAQRVAYIRSLASNPKYLFLDEVTSALDHESTRLISKSINAKKEEGVGIFLITHSEEFSNQLNRDATMEMENGELSFLP